MRKSFHSLALGCCVGAVAALSSSASAQIDPVVTTPTGYIVLIGAGDATVNTYRGQGYRIIDIDRVGTNQYDAVMVQNSGDYANSGEVWYPSITEGSLTSALTGKRLIDLQPWDNAGSTLFTAVAVANTGDDAVPGWGWLYNQTSNGAIDSWMSGSTLRPISIQRYTVGGSARWSGVAISNTGAAAAGHWYLWGATTSAISSTLQQYGGVITDVEINTLGTLFAAPTFNVTAVIKPIRGWWWYTGLDASEILPRAAALGARPIDIERYTTQLGATRFVVVYVDNTNPIESRMRALMSAGTTGDFGLYVKEVGGSVVAALNADFAAEPASTMKIVHGVRMVQRAQLGLAGPNGLDTLVYNPDTDNPQECPDANTSSPTNESIRAVLRRMFSVSDNNATKVIAELCGGLSALTSWVGGIQSGAVSQIEINHHIGCWCGSVPNNVGSARATSDLYEAAYDGTLLSAPWREELWGVISGSNTDGSVWFDTIITEEAAGLDMTTAEITAFRQALWYRLKNGYYGCDGLRWGGQAGIVRIPYKSGPATIYERVFTGMTFVHASPDPNIDIAYSSWAELFREQIRAALVTWADACVQAPTITSQPQSQIVTAGQNVTFSVAATGTGALTYQWRRDNFPIADGGNISGTSTPTLQIAGANEANEGWYRCLVTSPCGSVSSATAILTVQPPACVGDLNGNGTVDAADLSALLGAWGSTNAAADLDGSGSVGAPDLALLLSRWGACP